MWPFLILDTRDSRTLLKITYFKGKEENDTINRKLTGIKGSQHYQQNTR